MTDKLKQMITLPKSSNFEDLHSQNSNNNLPDAIDDTAINHDANNPPVEIKQLIQSILSDKEIGFKNTFPFPYKLVFTDVSGTIMFSSHNTNLTGNKSSQPQIEAGINLISENETTNGVSMAVEREEEVYIFGNEPFLQKEWRGWSGFVIPFYYHNKEIFGYFSLFSELESIDIQTYPFVKMMALLIETEINTGINKWGGIHFQDYLIKKLECYKLTPRERQIAVLWMMDYDHKRIGLEMGISENTVRVMTTRLNSKLKVHSKASLILRVLGVI